MYCVSWNKLFFSCCLVCISMTRALWCQYALENKAGITACDAWRWHTVLPVYRRTTPQGSLRKASIPACDVLRVKTLTINSPAYLATLLNSYKPACTLRSTNNNLLQLPHTKTVTETHAFRCAAPQLWNSLPADITSLHSLDCFRQKLKTFLFCQAYVFSAI